MLLYACWATFSCALSNMASTWIGKAADWTKRRGLVGLSAVFLLVPIILMYRAYSTSDVEAPKTWRPDRMSPVQVPASAQSVVSAVTNATLGVSVIFPPSLFLSAPPHCLLAMRVCQPVLLHCGAARATRRPCDLTLPAAY